MKVGLSLSDLVNTVNLRFPARGDCARSAGNPLGKQRFTPVISLVGSMTSQRVKPTPLTNLCEVTDGAHTLNSWVFLRVVGKQAHSERTTRNDSEALRRHGAVEFQWVDVDILGEAGQQRGAPTSTVGFIGSRNKLKQSKKNGVRGTKLSHSGYCVSR